MLNVEAKLRLFSVRLHGQEKPFNVVAMNMGDIVTRIWFLPGTQTTADLPTEVAEISETCVIAYLIIPNPSEHTSEHTAKELDPDPGKPSFRS